MTGKGIVEAVSPLAASIAGMLGYEIVGVEFVKNEGRRILRVFIDKEGGITVDDCEKFSEAFSRQLDLEDVIDERYYLEVSSPGVERPLNRPDHYEHFKGRLAELRTRQAVGGRKKFVGTIRGIDGDTVMLELDSAEVIRIPLGEIGKANLKVSTEELLKGETVSRRS